MPPILYKESVNSEAELEGVFLHEDQLRRYAYCVVKVEPNTRGAGFQFNSLTAPPALAQEYIDAVEEGIIASLEEGVLARFPVTDIIATLVMGRPDGDSDEESFHAAAAIAFRAACLAASPVLLEPIYSLEVVTPEVYAEPVIGDVNGRRAEMGEIVTSGTNKIIHATVPEAEMGSYGATLSTLSSGQGSHNMTFQGYGIVPETLAALIIAERAEE